MSCVHNGNVHTHLVQRVSFDAQRAIKSNMSAKAQLAVSKAVLLWCGCIETKTQWVQPHHHTQTALVSASHPHASPTSPSTTTHHMSTQYRGIYHTHPRPPQPPTNNHHISIPSISLPPKPIHPSLKLVIHIFTEKTPWSLGFYLGQKIQKGKNQKQGNRRKEIFGHVAGIIR